MNNYKNLVGQGGAIIKNFKDALKNNRNEGRSNDWLRAQNKVTAARYKKQLEDNANARFKECMNYHMDSLKKAQKLRKATAKEDKLLHLGQAQAYLGGNLDNVFKGFENLMLDPDNRKYKYIYEDYIKNRVLTEDPTYEMKAEGVFNKYRSPEEKEANKDLFKSEVIRAHAKTIDGMLEMAFEELEQDGKTDEFDLVEVWNDMVANAESQARSFDVLPSPEKDGLTEAVKHDIEQSRDVTPYEENATTE
jgi:hypothetical protein